MSKDTIYREDAIKALRLEYPMIPMFKSLREEWAIKTEGFRKAEEVIIKLPSADRPQGEWINKGAVCQCTRCKGYSRGLLEEKNGKLCEPHRLIYPRFCPNCGAKMKGAEDEI